MRRGAPERGSVSVVVAASWRGARPHDGAGRRRAGPRPRARRARTAADAAALAAAQELALPSGVSASDIAAGYAAAHEAELISCACETGTFEVRVEVRTGVGSLFLMPGERFAVARARAVVDLE